MMRRFAPLTSDQGALVAFSGLDGAGKSTQIALLVGALRAAGIGARSLWSRPGYTAGVMWAKALLRRCCGRALPPQGPSERRSEVLGRRLVRRLWLVAALIDLGCLYSIWIRWQLRRGRSIICDRYLCDALVDLQLRFPDDGVERWWLWRFVVWSAARPDVQFVMLVPVKEALARSAAKHEPFPESPLELCRRLDAYRALSLRDDYLLLDGCRPAADLHLEIIQAWSRATGMDFILPLRIARLA